MKRVRGVRAGLIMVVACLSAQAYANGGSFIGGATREFVIVYETLVVMVEAMLIALLFHQRKRRALYASFAANAASFLIILVVVSYANPIADTRATPGEIFYGYKSTGPFRCVMHLPWLSPVFFAINVLVETPVVWAICRPKSILRLVLGMLLIELVTWPAGEALYPQFLPGIRSRESRAKSYMRSYATGIESYFVDNNAYPPAVPMKSYIKTSDADEPWASRLMIPGRLTTPIMYITEFLPDPYGPVKGATFNYYTGANGWILVSPGPDKKYDIDPARDYNSSETQPSARLLLKCFDPTNGTTSQGDIFRVMVLDNESSATSAPI